VDDIFLMSHENQEFDSKQEKLIQIMQKIRNVRRMMTQEAVFLIDFTPLKEIVALLKQNGISFDFDRIEYSSSISFFSSSNSCNKYKQIKW
jgi:hypothetical protein